MIVKAYIGTNPESPAPAWDSMASLIELPDFLLATSAAVLIDIELERLFRAHFRELARDEYAALFGKERNGILATFNGKIRVGYATRFFGRDVYENLLLVEAVREAFAKSVATPHFDSSDIARLCEKLTCNSDERAKSALPPRMAFYRTILELQADLSSERRGDTAYAT